MEQQGKLVVVTVGTTKFDALVEAVDNAEVVACLNRHGYRRLLVQHGKGNYSIKRIFPSPVDGFEVQLKQYVPDLNSIIKHAALVISHCGAGSVFEALSFKVPLVVVPNPDLMDNHQAELADLLASQKLLVSTDPENLVQAIDQAQATTFNTYAPGKVGGIVNAIDQAVATLQ